MPNTSADSPTTSPSATPTPTTSGTDVPTDTRTIIRSFSPADVPHIVEFWNRAYRDQRNFHPLTPEIFQRRILDCPAFAPEGLLLAWAEPVRPAGEAKAARAAKDVEAARAAGNVEAGTRALVGMIHAFRPQPVTGVYARWGAQPGIAHLHVLPAWRRQGIGSRLLQAAQNWLYYCPVYVGAAGQACYGAVEGPRAPLFGSTQALAINAQDSATLQFFARHGYRIHEPGDVSMRLEMTQLPAPPATATPDLPTQMRVIEVSHRNPYTGEEPPGRAEYSLWGDNQGDPYTALLVVDDAQRLFGHIGWYPMTRAHHTAICSFWLAPQLRGRRVGAWLLDAALQRIYHAPPPTGGNRTPLPADGYHAVEVHTHSVRHPVATHLYEARGFRLETAWAALVKM